MSDPGAGGCARLAALFERHLPRAVVEARLGRVTADDAGRVGFTPWQVCEVLYLA